MDAVLNAKLQRARASCTERMARKLRDALPGGDDPPRAALWEFLRPLLSPAPRPTRGDCGCPRIPFPDMIRTREAASQRGIVEGAGRGLGTSPLWA